MTEPTTSPRALLSSAETLANEQKLWEAADLLMTGFAELGDTADAPEVDGLGRPIRGSSPKLMDKAADWLELLDNLEGHGEEFSAPPRHLRWAQWHTLSGQAEIRRGHPGRAIDHLEMASGLFESENMLNQAVPLIGLIVQCHLATGDVGQAETALHRARTMSLRDDAIAEKWKPTLDDLGRDVAERL